MTVGLFSFHNLLLSKDFLQDSPRDGFPRLSGIKKKYFRPLIHILFLLLHLLPLHPVHGPG